VCINVGLSLGASNCDDVTDTAIIHSCATSLGVSTNKIRKFHSSCTESVRRVLVDQDLSIEDESLHRKLTASLSASFEVITTLSSTSYTSVAAYQAAVSTTLATAVSDGSLASNLNTACTSCSMTVGNSFR